MSPGEYAAFSSLVVCLIQAFWRRSAPRRQLTADEAHFVERMPKTLQQKSTQSAYPAQWLLVKPPLATVFAARHRHRREKEPERQRNYHWLRQRHPTENE